MKAAEAREMSVADLRDRIQVEKGNLETMKINHAISPLEDTSKFKKTRKKKESLPIIFMPRNQYLPALLFFLISWGAIYYVLVTWTNSTVPLLDSFTNAVSFVALWALARKYVEQWIFWIIVDVVCTFLYIQKGIPFKAMLYGLYVAIAIAGYRKWKSVAKTVKRDQK